MGILRRSCRYLSQTQQAVGILRRIRRYLTHTQRILSQKEEPKAKERERGVEREQGRQRVRESERDRIIPFIFLIFIIERRAWRQTAREGLGD